MKLRGIGFALAFAFAIAGAVGSFQACGGPSGGGDAGTDTGTGDAGTGDTGTGDTGTGDTGTGDTGTGDAATDGGGNTGSPNDFQDTAVWLLDQSKEIWVRFTPKFDGEIRSLKAKSGSVEDTDTYGTGDAPVLTNFYETFQLTEAADSKTWPAGSYTLTVKYRKDNDTSDRTTDLTATAGDVGDDGAIEINGATEAGSLTTVLLASASATHLCVTHIRLYDHTDGHLIGVYSWSYSESSCERQIGPTQESFAVPANTNANQSVDIWVEGFRLLTDPAIDAHFGAFETGVNVDSGS